MTSSAASGRPVFGFLLVGGPALSGALVRDIRLANELADRGYEVHAWWAMDRPRESSLRPAVNEHWLFQGLRYQGGFPGRDLCEVAGRLLSRFTKDKNRARAVQKRPEHMTRIMQGYMRLVAEGVERDRRVVRRFARALDEAGVTHMLPMLGGFCPWVTAARREMSRPLKCCVTFQGYELYINYARTAGCEFEVLRQLVDAVEQSDYPAIAVSEDYVARVHEDIGVPLEQLVAIPPGVPAAEPFDRGRCTEVIRTRFRAYEPGLPLVTFLGRRDTEKGIDLLLYAVKMLRERGLRFQTVICGPTLFGDHYAQVCAQLAEDLRLPVMWRNRVPDEVRTALFCASRCLVYPSIHREPFGMVPVEALAYGTPAVVPDHGGIAAAVSAEGETGGLHFRVWDSGDLAAKIERMLTDDALHRTLAEAGPRIAAYYSVPNLADRVLGHLGLDRDA